MAPGSEIVECPTCKGEGMIRHCGQAVVCWRCKGLGELDRDEAAKPATA
ncbi:MAG: hypothetical protein AB1603_00405 [Chloroflexota bacterium]